MLTIQMASRPTCGVLLFVAGVSACSGGSSAPSNRRETATPAGPGTPSTVVTAVYPGGEVIPENQRRVYVQFSGPMGQHSGLGHIALLDKDGREITGTTTDTGQWSGDQTRYTLAFDPAPMKSEALPNRAVGSRLHRGQTFTLVVKTNWLDARGVPLKSEFRRNYRVGPPDEGSLSTLGWHIMSPSAGTRAALAITFPEPLDHVLLQRAITVSHAAAVIRGEAGIDTGEMRWTFVPRDAWQPGVYTVAVQPILEDLAGNRIGHAFEVRAPGEAVAPDDDRPVLLPFRIAKPSAR
jgi:hypothetical protein